MSQLSDNNHIIYKIAEAIAKELASLNVKIVCDIAKDIENNKSYDLTPFNLLAVAALKATKDLVKMTPDGTMTDNLIVNHYINKALYGFE